ncbi:MAG TPA: trypsin-like serine protease, partial [Candidatus Atribacteria bacterium]|nr:trypsin-like serine protease [Candidatus Atribacteria bacterium]
MNIIKKSILPLVISFNAVAESPPEITIPPLPGFQYYATVDKDSTPYSIKARKDYSVKLSNCGASLIAPSWVITAGHCITRAKQSNPKTIRVRFTSKNKDITFRRATKVYKHKYRDLALIQLKKQASYNVQPILLLKDNISPEDGYIKIKKVYNQRLYPNITTRSTKKSHNLYVSKSERKGKAGSSGSPWVYES